MIGNVVVLHQIKALNVVKTIFLAMYTASQESFIQKLYDQMNRQTDRRADRRYLFIHSDVIVSHSLHKFCKHFINDPRVLDSGTASFGDLSNC